jgi:hypothetical protein
LKTSGDVYELAIRADANGVPHFNIIHFVLEQDRTAAQMQTAGQTAADAFKEIWRGDQHTSMAWKDWRFQQVSGAGVTYNASNCRRSGGDVYTGNLTGTLTGGVGTSDAYASSIAVVTSLRTGFVGRSKNGRMFVGGFPEGAINGNSMVSATAGNLTTNMATFFGLYGDGGTNPDLTWVVWSRYIASGCKYVAALPHPVLTHVQAADHLNSYVPIQSATINTLLAPMHRRKPGVGV